MTCTCTNWLTIYIRQICILVTTVAIAMSAQTSTRQSKKEISNDVNPEFDRVHTNCL